ncbi:MAG: carbohydrate ABC transporter permease [Defluviitaleaceae bacterium]|nr:carbohydrate ABC transporter permease [Defluviitaleaceae bacterium]
MVGKKSIGSVIFKVIGYALLVTLGIMSLYPFIVMFMNATRSMEEIRQSALPFWFSDNLGGNWAFLRASEARGAFNAFTGFRNSLIVSSSTTFFALYFSCLTAFALTAYEWRLREPFFAFILAVMMMPGMVGTVGFVEMVWSLGMTNNFIPLVLPAIAAPAVVFFMRQYLRATFTPDIINSARIDGAGEFRIFNQIVLPMMKPAIATQAIFIFVGSWNALFMPSILLNRAELFTMPMMVQTLTGNLYAQELGAIYLGLAMTVLPLFIFYFALSRYIIAGVQLGGVKE